MKRPKCGEEMEKGCLITKSSETGYYDVFWSTKKPIHCILPEESQKYKN